MKKPIIQFEDFSFQYQAQSEPTLKQINLTIFEGGKGSDLLVRLALVNQRWASVSMGLSPIFIKERPAVSS